MTTPVPNFPQPETPIRDRAWTDGQRLARLRELAELWKAGDFEERECAEKLLAILDAEGDGVPARSGGVSDADVEAALSEFHDWTGLCDDERDDAQHRVAMRAALEAVAPMLASLPRASSTCPMDGIDHPHAHSNQDVIAHLHREATRFQSPGAKELFIHEYSEDAFAYYVESTCYPSRFFFKLEEAKEYMGRHARFPGTLIPLSTLMLASARVPDVDLVERCKEVLAWKSTGLLRGDYLREYAKAAPNHDDDLQWAEEQTKTQAMRVLAVAPKPEPTICWNCNMALPTGFGGVFSHQPTCAGHYMKPETEE